MKQLFVLLALGLTLLSCSDSNSKESSTSVNASETTAKVSSKELNQSFDDAWNNRDSAKLIGFLADDIQMLAGKSHFSGKQEVIEKFIRKNLNVTSNLKATVVSSGEDNGLAYEAGTFTLDVKVPDMEPFVDKGNYNFVWKKGADNQWKVASINMEDLPIEKK